MRVNTVSAYARGIIVLGILEIKNKERIYAKKLGYFPKTKKKSFELVKYSSSFDIFSLVEARK